jgi:RimJ/RimL family protein N-acetyltransferase
MADAISLGEADDRGMPSLTDMPAKTELRVRPVERADAAALAGLFERMSAESRRRRYLAVKPRLSGRELVYLTDVDHVRHEALGAFDWHGRMVAVARYAELSDCSAELAVEVADDYHGRGIGSELVRRITERAEGAGYARLTATTLWENAAARALFKRLGFRAIGSGGASVDLELRLRDAECSAVAA